MLDLVHLGDLPYSAKYWLPQDTESAGVLITIILGFDLQAFN